MTGGPNFWRWIAIGALVLCAALIGERHVRDLMFTASQPRVTTPRGDLVSDEQRTTGLFAAAAPSVVSIQTAAGANPFTREQGNGGSGSGFLWDRAGRVVTNRHVIDGASRIIVVLDDGRALPSRLVGAAPIPDGKSPT